MKLIKLMYLADRSHLENYNEAISGDHYANMPHGPVLSSLYNLIRGISKDSCTQTLWDSLFYKKEYVLLANNTEQFVDELSKAECETLKAIDARYKRKDCFQLEKVTHGLPEWKDPDGSSVPLTLRQILTVLGRSAKDISLIMSEKKAYSNERSLFDKYASQY